MKIKSMIAMILMVVLLFTGCEVVTAKEFETSSTEIVAENATESTTEPPTEIAESTTKSVTEDYEEETQWIYNKSYKGIITITEIDEESFVIIATNKKGECVIFLAVTTPYEVGKKFYAEIYADNYIRVYSDYNGKYIGSYEVKEPFDSDKILGDMGYSENCL